MKQFKFFSGNQPNNIDNPHNTDNLWFEVEDIDTGVSFGLPYPLKQIICRHAVEQHYAEENTIREEFVYNHFIGTIENTYMTPTALIAVVRIVNRRDATVHRIRRYISLTSL